MTLHHVFYGYTGCRATRAVTIVHLIICTQKLELFESHSCHGFGLWISSGADELNRLSGRHPRKLFPAQSCEQVARTAKGGIPVFSVPLCQYLAYKLVRRYEAAILMPRDTGMVVCTPKLVAAHQPAPWHPPKLFRCAIELYGLLVLRVDPEDRMLPVTVLVRGEENEILARHNHCPGDIHTKF